MSEAEQTSRRVASVEDADESDNPIEGTGRYAESSVASPVKERPNTGRTRKDKTRRDSTSPLASGLTDSDSTVHPREKSARDRERRDSRDGRDGRDFSSPHKKALAISKQTLAMRPAAKHANTTPHLSHRGSDEASYYGVTTATVTPAVSRSRPRAATQRPASYYGTQSRPPQANVHFYARQPPAPAPIPTSYPPQSWAQAGPMAYPVMSPAGLPPPPPPDYFGSRPIPPQQHLLDRFNNRPASAMGMRPSPLLVNEEYVPEEQRYIVRRSSKKAKDRLAMPPPARPHSARPGPMFRPPSTPAPRRGLRFEDEELDPDRDLFHVSPLTYEYAHSIPPPRVRRPSFGAPSLSYDSGSYRTEVAGNSRRNSYRNSVSSISDYEEKLRQAQAYQEDVAGGPQVPLTAETLRRASRNGGSSRSTRSSESRDESDYRQSATTRTTRSSNNNNNNEEDVTIRIKGVRSVEVGGARMHCDDGAEINIASRAAPAPPGPGGYRGGGSDRSSYVGGGEDHHRRIEDIRRPPPRTRSGSQAGSFSRAPPLPRYETAAHAPMPRYDGVRFDQYGYPIPSYPSYPPPPPGYI